MMILHHRHSGAFVRNRLLQVVIRSQSKSATQAAAVRDQRLAGRRRFYKTVDVQAVPPPWEDSSLMESSSSVISAGVDGTDSATGVTRRLETDVKHLQQQLIPRVPGSNEVTLSKNIDWFGVTLDGRLLRTPMGQRLVVPSSLLASCIAAEWNMQSTYIQPTQMPLMTLSCTTLDQTCNNTTLYEDESFKYLHTDSVCYFADPMEDRVLYQRQHDAWNELHKSIQSITGHMPATAHGMEGLIMSKQGNGLPHHIELIEYARSFVQSLDAWHLTAFFTAASESKSFWMAWAIVSGRFHTQEAIEAARVEEEFQISNWGLVEGGHDYDRLNAAVQLTAAVLLKDSLSVDCQLFD